MAKISTIRSGAVGKLLLLLSLGLIIYIFYSIPDGFLPHKPTQEENVVWGAEEICSSIYLYHKELGAFPDVNASLAKALAGDNPKHAEFLESGRIPVDGSGRFLDPSGKPFRIAITQHTIEIFYSEGGIVATCDLKTGQTHAFNGEE